ncbi:sensor histidine kinase [Carboxylicivirga caseinilyticus]|uniref:sensor histidine kinase n=1 Tax=Carboxylicivirga caseinilyticus TaxID=3417572 RepID=UPI003D345E83|nr:hypothetical protein [Marinilabiliaceae bacterium A049]
MKIGPATFLYRLDIFCSILLLWSLGVVSAHGQEFQNTIHQQWHFNHLTVDDGLSNNFVQAINQDKYGYIWIATTFGLNRFNGLSIECFYHSESDSSSLNSNYISSLFIDSQKQLLIGTDKGLQQFNYQTQNFINVPIPDGINSREVFCIAEDLDNQLLVGTSSGLYTGSTDTREFQKIELKQLGLPNDSIYRIRVDDKNNLWIATYKSGLHYYNRKQNSIKSYVYQLTDEKGLPDNWIHYLYIDKVNSLWVGTYNTGFARFNPSDSTFTHYFINPKEEFTRRIRTIFEDTRGNMYIGSRSGLFLFDKVSGKSSLYALEDHSISKLSQNSVTCSFVDKHDNVWLGTHSGGVSYFNTLQKKFNHVKQVKNDSRFLNSGSVHCFSKYGDKLYIGTEKGINVFDKSNRRFSYWVNDLEDPNSLSYDDVKDIAIESKDSIWVATNRGGLNLLNSKGKVIKLFRHDKSNPYSLPSDNIYNVFLDSRKDIWVLSNDDWDRLSSVVSRYDRKNDRFIHYRKPFFMGFTESSSGELYVGGYRGFYKYDRKSDDFIAFTNDTLIFRTDVLFVDNNDIIWVGSYKGLSQYNFKTDTFIDVSKELDLGAKEIYGIVGKQNTLWISSNNGLIRINDIEHLSGKSVNTFVADDGLQSREFNYNAYFLDEDGYCYFGGDNGFNVFHSDSIVVNPYPPEIYLSSINIEGKEVFYGSKLKGEVIINQSVYETKKIYLSHQVRSFTLSFDVLHFANAKSNRYKYKIDENEEWTYADATNNYITFRKLAPGTHPLIIYGINSDGVESLHPVDLIVVVHPPLWRHTWFILLLVVLLTVMVFVIIYLRERRLIKQKQRLERIVQLKTKELVLRNEELSKQKEEIEEQKEEIVSQRDTIFHNNRLLEEYANELENKVAQRTADLDRAKEKAEESDRLKTSFLKNISHEIRTPLNAIIGFINVIGDDLSNPDNQNYFEIIKSSGYTLMKTIEDVIDYAKIETDAISVYIEPTSVQSLLGELLEFYESELIKHNKDSAQSVQIKISHLVDDFGDVVYSDRARLKQIIGNLLSNAIKFTHQGEITFGVCYASEWYFGFYVQDTGIGINKVDQGKVFDRFRKIEENTQNLYRGGGLGLSISKYLVELLGGTIEVESVPGAGSNFSFVVRNYRKINKKFDSTIINLND